MNLRTEIIRILREYLNGTKISELPLGSPLIGPELLEAVQNGVSIQITASQLTGGGIPVSAFVQLSDVPSSYVGFGGYKLVVKGTEDGIEFIPDGGGGGTVVSVVSGSGITVDSTDAANPVVNLGGATTGSQTELFPDVDNTQVYYLGTDAATSQVVSVMVLKSRTGIYQTTEDGLGNSGSVYIEPNGVTITGTGTGSFFNVGIGVETTFGGIVTLAQDPAQPLEAATKQYVDANAGTTYTFTAADFNVSGTTVSIDYTNGQSASGSTKGFLTSADWTTFNGKQNAITTLPVTQGGTGTSTAFTTGSIVFAGASGVYSQNNNGLFWDDSNLRLRVNNSGATFAAPQTGTLLHFVSSSGTFNGRVSLDSYVGAQTTGSIFQGRTALGTAASPTAVGADQILAAFGGDGYGTSQFHGNSVGAFTVRAASTHTNTNGESYLTMSTSPSGSITATERFRVGSAGQLGIGGATFGTTGQIFTSGGPSAAPTWTTPNFWALSGTSSFTGNVVIAAGTNTLQFTTANTAGTATGVQFSPTLTGTASTGEELIGVDINATFSGTLTGDTVDILRLRVGGTKAFEMNSLGTLTLGSSNGPSFIAPVTSGQTQAIAGVGLMIRNGGGWGAASRRGMQFVTRSNNVSAADQIAFWMGPATGDKTWSVTTGGPTNLTFTNFLITPDWEVSSGSGHVIRGIVYDPTLTNVTAVGSHYGLLIGSTALKNGFGTLTPTAQLHIGAGSATAGTAPIKLTSGTVMTTAETGAIEYNGTNLFFTRSGTTREGVLTQSAVTTEVIVSDTSVTVNINGTTYKLLARA